LIEGHAKEKEEFSAEAYKSIMLILE